jgi:hypothetical protein
MGRLWDGKEQLMIRSLPEQTSVSTAAHPDDVREVHRRILEKSPARARYIEAAPGRRVHVIEAGEGPPVVLLHDPQVVPVGAPVGLTQ